LQTVFQYLDFGDTLHFELRTDNQIILLPQENFGISQHENLITRAAYLLQQTTKVEKGVTIHWDKKIPLGAGLGGGSSNAATCLYALNALWQLNFSNQQLRSLGLKLGADIPFFLFGQSAIGEGIGELLTPVELKEPWVLVITPPCHVMTAKMYADPELTRNTPTFRIGTLIQDEIEDCISEYRNDFEPLVRKLYPEIDDSLKWLSNYGDARLSGSGASVFACFDSYEKANEAITHLPPKLKGFIAKGINRSPLMIEQLESVSSN
jgi:4-diphosphocytidyl-2-C-methyl-D-erythritol kinase